VKIKEETQTLATVTLQNYFKLYEKICGMTGTAMTEAEEFYKIYELDVVAIPTNRGLQRIAHPDVIYSTEEFKWRAIADEIENYNRWDMVFLKNHEFCVGDVESVDDSSVVIVDKDDNQKHTFARDKVAKVQYRGRPILVGTVSIEKSERLSRLLDKRGVKHEVLNAKNHKREADIVSQAGRFGAVTIATNMAGRGTDIKLTPDAYAIGGLHVICSELHDSARIDRQLIGRCGRQGDPGSYRQYLALDDDLLSSGLGQRRAEALLRHAESPASSLTRLAPLFYSAQAKIERNHYQARKQLLYHDRERQKFQREMGQDPHLDTAGSS